ncbi:SMI1/KNR4 family protein [Hydrogenophaga sp. SL48]|uniref:SMI1/KNR4 family protein n=1 Tax=Hydrogenophaga sp. SL48 TaxID=2806347 RepID=UPI001F36C1A1|nr:SMI1/KNR4 family protein [Hydrogenophaga sp. SL48]UJW79819.1 SMI1/KNR4 family protein [Hydrogenophaga sp. SL48]
MSRTRVIGTTEESIARAEQELGRKLPTSFREWLLLNNGLGIDGVHIYPVLDDRDPRKTWDSIVRNYQVGWEAWIENLDNREEVESLLPFADFGSGDYYCFNYADISSEGEPKVVLWSHETDELQPRGDSFTQFAQRVLAREFEHD